MKKFATLPIAFVAALGIALPLSASAHPHGPGHPGQGHPGYGHHGPGHYGSPPQMWSHGPGDWRDEYDQRKDVRSKLSAEQRAGLRTLHEEARPALRALREELRENGEALRQSLSADGYSSEVERLARRQGELIGQMIAQRAQVEARARELLGDDYRPRGYGRHDYRFF